MSGGRFRYLPALDGLRAFAVLAVLCYHGGMSWALGGFLGVDAFFVLSGFLITSLLLVEWKGTNGIALTAFWIRRAKRLLPALFLVLGGVALYAAFAAAPTELGRIRDDGLASLGYVANWRFVFSHQSYFDTFGVPSPLRHMWSLAIEEQFYLVWPMIVYGVLRWRRGSVGALAAVAGAIAIGSTVLMVSLYNPNGDPSRVYYGTDTRVSSLLVGALLAMFATKHTFGKTIFERRSLHVASVLAVGALGFMWVTTTDGPSWLYLGGFLVAALLVAVVIADVSQEQMGPVAKVMSLRPLRWIGAISYGLYLWHWPIYVFLSPVRTGLDDAALFAVRLAATFIVATLSYYLVEQPIRTGSWHGWRVRVATPAAVIGVAGVLLWSTANAVPAGIEVSVGDLRPPTTSAPTGAPTPAVDRPARIMLVGDSVANSLAPGITNQAAARGFEFWNASLPGCGFATEEGEHQFGEQWLSPVDRCQPSWRTRWPQQLKVWNPDVVVVGMGGQVTYDRRFAGNVIPFDTPDGINLAREELDAAVSILSSRGAKVVLLTALYGKLGWPAQIDIARSGFNNAWIDEWNAVATEVAAFHPKTVQLVDLNGRLDPGGKYADTIDGVDARSDGVHLTPEASDLAGAWLAPQFLAAVPKGRLLQK